MASSASTRNQDIVLKGGLVVDGTGAPPVTANLLIRAGRVHRISPKPIRTTGVSIDCAGKVVAPGFVDACSHLDWHLPLKAHDELKYPFLAQGITTVVTGHCGVAAAGFREASAWKARIADAPPNNGLLTLAWDTVEEYLARLAGSGASHNVAILAGHGSTRASLRGVNPSPLHPYETKELLWLLEKAMDEGARGVSLGLQHEPGMHARPDELAELGRLVKRKDRILSVHLRALSAIIPGPGQRLSAEARNLAALREALDLSRATGARLEISHLMFFGARTWRTVDRALALIDAAIAAGVDVRFDMHPYPCGATVVGALLPQWLLARGPEAWTEPRSLRRARREIWRAGRLLGFSPSDVQVTAAGDPDLEEYDGRFLGEIARVRRMHAVDALIDIARRSGGHARVLVHRGGTERIAETLMRHPACLFGTGALVERAGVQNPAAYGAFPHILQMARDRRIMPLEEAVRRLTGAPAERYRLAGRGLLAEGAAADVTVFDWQTVADNTTRADASEAPTGIDYVFVNGVKIIGAGKRENPLNAGVPIA
jgi:N-acyl-D-amino-acid deacylase